MCGRRKGLTPIPQPLQGTGSEEAIPLGGAEARDFGSGTKERTIDIANCGPRRHDGDYRARKGCSLITVPELSAEALGSFLSEHLNRNFGSTHAHLAELIPSIARIALECIGNSDALYHNVEHTMLVTLVGYDIMKGRALLRPTYASDVAHLLVACLL